MLDVAKFVAGLHEYIGRAVSPLADRIKTLEERAPALGPKGDPGRDGKDAEIDLEAVAAAAAKMIQTPKDGRDGKDADPELIKIEVRRAVDALPRPQDGKDGRDGRDGKDGQDVSLKQVEIMVRAAVASIPPAVQGKDGRDGIDGKDADPEVIRAEVRRAIDALPIPKDGADGTDGKDGQDGQNGKDADPAAIEAAVEREIERRLPGAVAKAIESILPKIAAKAAELIPLPKDGKDGCDGADGRDGADGKSVDEAEILERMTERLMRIAKDLPQPKDGRDGKDGCDAEPIDLNAVVAQVRALIPTPRDGIDGRDAPPVDVDSVVDMVLRRLPAVKDGKDGAHGADGKSVTSEDVRPILEAESAKWALDFERRASDVLQRAIERMPAPEKGADGKDGLSVDDFDVVVDGRKFIFSLACGDRVVTKEIKLPIPIDRGVYRSGGIYDAGDVLTFGGGLWISQKDNNSDPIPSDSWRLAVRRGKDGKDAQQ